ncbi:MAG: DUF447 family protein [Nitrososphaerales archaeon]
MVNLRSLGFFRGIAECIVSTYNLDGSFNAAPMGVSLSNDNLIVRPFKATRTYRNLKHYGCCVINVSDRAELFYLTVFKDSLPKEWFDKGKKVNAPRLVLADLWIEAEVKSLDSISQDRAQFALEAKEIYFKLKKPKVYKRSNHALMESVIHATRIKLYLKKKEYNKANGLINLVNHYYSLVKRVAPDSKHERLMKELIKSIDKWSKIYGPSKEPILNSSLEL